MTIKEFMKKVDTGNIGGIHLTGVDSMGDEFYGMTYHAGDKIPKDLLNEEIKEIWFDDDIDVVICCDH